MVMVFPLLWEETVLSSWSWSWSFWHIWGIVHANVGVASSEGSRIGSMDARETRSAST